jgi:F-box/leucine-rich repeat protein 14
MRKVKRTVSIAMLICAGFVLICSAVNAAGTAHQKRVSARDLPGKYQAKQAKLPDTQSKERVVHFPKDRSIGWLYHVERPLHKDCLWHEVLVWERERLGEAQGDVRVPADKMLRLDVGKNAWKGSRPFAGLKPDDIQIMNFSQYPHASDSVLKDVARLTGVEVLFFGEGNFTERGLKHLTVLKQLKALWLPGRVHSRGLTYLSKLPSLEYLCFGGPMVTDAKMVHIGRLTSLTQLSIAGSKVGKGLAHLKGLKSLRFLSLAASRNEHIDKHLVHIAELNNIEELNLSDTLVGDAGLEHLKGMIKLKKLNIGNRYYSVSHNITDAGMVHLNHLKSLEELTLSHTGVTDIGLAQLSGLTELKKLNVGRDVTDKGMAALAKMKSLDDLAISSPHVTDAGMRKLTECPCLKSLALQGCQITNAGLVHLAKLKTLTKLSLSRTQVTGSGLTVLKELPLLTGLNVRYIDFGEAGMTHLAGLKSLEHLWIDAPEGKITDDDLADLSGITSLKNLQISIRDSSQSLITNQGLAHLAKLKALESLNIHSCQKVTDAGLRHFEGLTCLKRLRLDFSQITKKGISRLKAKIPGLEVIEQRAIPRRNVQPEPRNKRGRTVQRRPRTRLRRQR